MILEVTSRGPLTQADSGRIVARFDNSAYAETTAGLVCLLPPGAPSGAIHILLQSWPAFELNDRVAWRGGAIWQPPPWPSCTTKLARRRVEQLGNTEIGDPQSLLGRGQGLTPAGDDILCGWFVTSRALGQPRPFDEILQAAQHHTHQISRAHLQAAAQGLATEPFHRVLRDLLDEKIAHVDLTPLDQIGHTSGREALKGAMAALSELASWDDLPARSR